jgi:hypothetical protein
MSEFGLRLRRPILAHRNMHGDESNGASRKNRYAGELHWPALERMHKAHSKDACEYCAKEKGPNPGKDLTPWLIVLSCVATSCGLVPVQGATRALDHQMGSRTDNHDAKVEDRRPEAKSFDWRTAPCQANAPPKVEFSGEHRVGCTRLSKRVGFSEHATSRPRAAE